MNAYIQNAFIYNLRGGTEDPWFRESFILSSVLAMSCTGARDVCMPAAYLQHSEEAFYHRSSGHGTVHC
eukprot:1003675-Amphidinium_carterae.1